MASAFTDKAREVEATVNEILTASGWTKRRYGGAATGSFYVAKTGTSAGEFIGLYCDWKHDGALYLWPVTEEPTLIANAVRDTAESAAYPKIDFLTNSGGEHNEDDLPEKVVAQVPFEDGPGDVRPYLVRIEGRFYVLGNLEVSFDYPIWDGLALPPQEVVTKASEAAIVAMRAKSAPGVIVYPLDFDDMPGRCVISVALPVREDSPATMKERLANAFCGYEESDKLIAPAA